MWSYENAESFIDEYEELMELMRQEVQEEG